MRKNIENRIDRLELAFVRDGVFETSLNSQTDDVLYVPSSPCDFSGWEPEDHIFIPSENNIIPEPPDWLPPQDDNDAQAWLSSSMDNKDEEGQIESKGFRIGDWWLIRDDTPFKNSPYKHNYRVMQLDGYTTLGFVYYQTYLLNRDFIYLRISNKCLYSEDVWQLIQKFITDFSLQFQYVSKLDIAIDSKVDVGNILYNNMKDDPSITWVVNGRKVHDRDATMEQIFWLASGSLNDPIKNKSLYIKQEQGLSQVAYDKTLEINERSGKRYQIVNNSEPELWSNDELIYRNEIRLDRMCIIKYLNNRGITDNELFNLIQSAEYRYSMFELLTQRLIRWRKNGRLTNIAELVSQDHSDYVDRGNRKDGEQHLSTSIVC